MCAAAIGCRACARGETCKEEASAVGKSATPEAHNGQSMLAVVLASEPSSVVITIFMPPEAEQTICRSVGFTSGEAMAAPMKSANQTSTRRARILALRKLCIARLYELDLGSGLEFCLFSVDNYMRWSTN